jgi:ribonuclease P protein component
VTRNRVKRRVREIVRLHLDRFAPGDYVLIAKPTAATATYAALSGDVLALFSQITAAPKTQPARGSHPGAGRGARR